MTRYYDFLSRWRRVVFAVWLIVLGSISLGAFNLQFTTNYRVFFSEENPQLQTFLKMQRTYNEKDNVLFVVSVAQGSLFNAETLTAITELTRLSWQLHYATRVDSLTNFQHSVADGDTIAVFPLVTKPNTLTAQALKKIQAVALNEPQLVGRLINPQATFTGVNVNFNIPAEKALAAIPIIAAQAEKMAAQIQKKYPQLKVQLTGIVIMDQALTTVPMQDMAKLVPLMFLLIAMILYLFFNNGTAITASLSLLFLTIGATMGVAGWLDLLLSPPTAVVPIIIITIAVADSVHILVNYQTNLLAGESRDTALLHSLKLNFQAIFLTSITTIIGFLGLNYSDVPPFRALGNLVALGTLIAFFLSMSFLPAVLLILPKQSKVSVVRGQCLMRKTGVFVVKKNTWVLTCALLIAVFFISFIEKNRLNDQFINYFDKSINFRVVTDNTIENLTGLYLLEFEVDTGFESGVFKTANLQTIEALSDWLRQQPEVLHVDSLSDIIKRINKNLFADAEAYYALPSSAELAAQEVLLFELSLPYGLDLSDKLNSQKSATRLSISVAKLSSAEVLALVDRANKWFKLHSVATTQLTVSGTPLMFAHISQRNISSMLIGTSVVLVLISLILLLVFKSVKIGLLSLIPNLAPAALAFGLWGLVKGEIGMTLAVVSCMTLGIIIDDTVHFLSKYLQLRRMEQQDNEQAVINTFASVGTALLITSCSLMAGFLVLALSSFMPNADMGLLTAMTIFFALLADFFIFPPLLLLFKAR